MATFGMRVKIHNYHMIVSYRCVMDDVMCQMVSIKLRGQLIHGVG